MIDIRSLGEYEVILADPPWDYYKAYNTHGIVKDFGYKTMSLDDIKEMKLPAAKDSVLFLWTTSPQLDVAIDVMRAWGYTYKTSAIWEKVNTLGMGFYFRINHELLLVGVKGNAKCPAPGDRPASIIKDKLRSHSQKPDRVYSMIEAMYPDRSKIELFARRRRAGWSSWGNQLNDTVQTLIDKIEA